MALYGGQGLGIEEMVRGEEEKERGRSLANGTVTLTAHEHKQKSHRGLERETGSASERQLAHMELPDKAVI